MESQILRTGLLILLEMLSRSIKWNSIGVAVLCTPAKLDLLSRAYSTLFVMVHVLLQVTSSKGLCKIATAKIWHRNFILQSW